MVNINALVDDIHRKYPGQQAVYVRADRETTYDPLAQVLAALGDARLGVNLVTQPDENAGRSVSLPSWRMRRAAPSRRAEPLRKAFAGSLITHALVIAMLTLSGIWKLTTNWGTEHASSGSVGVGMVKTIPIPSAMRPMNPLANDTKSLVPRSARARDAEAAGESAAERRHRDPEQVRETEKSSRPARNRRYCFVHLSNTSPIRFLPTRPQATSSPMYGMQGAGGIDIGPASVLGTRFGAYVDLMRDRISQHWNTADVRALPSQNCAVTFTIARNGTVTNVQVSQPSGNYLLDTSAKRAMMDANPLPGLPPQFDRSDATVELWFQLKQ